MIRGYVEWTGPGTQQVPQVKFRVPVVDGPDDILSPVIGDMCVMPREGEDQMHVYIDGGWTVVPHESRDVGETES